MSTWWEVRAISGVWVAAKPIEGSSSSKPKDPGKIFKICSKSGYCKLSKIERILRYISIL